MSQNFSSENSQVDSDQEENSQNEMVIENEDNISGNQISQEENIQDKDIEIINIKESEDQKLATYYFPKEDHTLGNALVFMINQHPEINFCGYSLLHPSEQGFIKRQKNQGYINRIIRQFRKCLQYYAKQNKSYKIINLINLLQIQIRQFQNL